jgi:IclR family acetate operon transcriptional repressor
MDDQDSNKRSPATDFERSGHDRVNESPGSSSALDRALSVIETILESDQPIGLQEISARLGLPRQTTHRIINNLLNAGLIQRHYDRDRFAVGPRMRRLALGTMSESPRSWPAHSVLEELSERTGETSNLCVLDGNMVLLIDRVESHWALRIHSEVGRRLEFHSSSTGKLLVAHLPKERRNRLVSNSPLKRFTPHTITVPAKLEEEFAKIRRLGYSVSNQETTLGLFSIARSICAPNGRILAGLSCQAPLVRMSVEQGIESFLPALSDAKERLEALIKEDFE